MRRPLAVAATVAAAALGYAWWVSTRPVQWTGGWT
jgi:multidrug resistance efflux pump